jgi:hypothetical protein
MTQMVDHFKEAMRLLIAAPVHLHGVFYAKRFSDGTLVIHENIKRADCFCAAGALYNAMGLDPNKSEDVPKEYAHALGFKSWGAVYIWNDKSNKDEVLTRFAETINTLEKM